MSNIDLKDVYITLNELKIESSKFKILEEPIVWESTHESIDEHLYNTIEAMLEEKLRGE
jgi:hypothetical protein